MATCQRFPAFTEDNFKYMQGYVVALEEVLRDVSPEGTYD